MFLFTSPFFSAHRQTPRKKRKKTLFHSRAAPRRSGGRKGRSDKEEKMFQTHHGATNELSAFLFHREWGYFLFELLQDGVLPPLKCPLCPEGVSLSAAKSDRQSGALKAHTPFCSQPLLRQTPGLRSHTHTDTHRLGVFSETGTQLLQPGANIQINARLAGLVCVKVLCVNKKGRRFFLKKEKEKAPTPAGVRLSWARADHAALLPPRTPPTPSIRQPPFVRGSYQQVV